jgi:putative endonuclease
MNTKEKGDIGENIAEQILIKSGYEILERNYRFKRAEIDLICLKPPLLVFVEVKSLNSSKHGYPEERVNYFKVKKILEAAEHYIYAINWQKDIRFDILSIDLKDSSNFLHIEDAFY